MNYSIHKVITNLPRSLFTPEIVKEGIKHGDVGVIDYIPRKFMTEETLLCLIRKNKNSYESYDLRRIPKHLRSVDICEDAVRWKKR